MQIYGEFGRSWINGLIKSLDHTDDKVVQEALKILYKKGVQDDRLNKILDGYAYKSQN